MKLKQEFVLREVAGENLLIPIVGINDKFDGIITLNETSTFIWKCIEKEMDENEIVEEILKEYDAEIALVKSNVHEFCCHLREMGIIE